MRCRELCRFEILRYKELLMKLTIFAEFEIMRTSPLPQKIVHNKFLELEFFLRPTVSRPVRLGIGSPFGTLDQI
jgi:hypothetical protein